MMMSGSPSKDYQPRPNFPGWRLYNAIASFTALRRVCLDFFNQDCVDTWTNEYQISNKCVSRLQSDLMISKLKTIEEGLTGLKPELTDAFDYIFEPNVREEWFATYLTPIENKIANFVALIAASRET